MLNENEGYAGGSSGFIYRTTVGGENWNFHATMVATLTDISFPPSGDTGYCCGINGNIWSIDSTGVTKMTSNINGSLNTISFPVNSEEGWVCGGSIILHFFNDTWIADQVRPSGGYNAIYMVDTLNGWAVGDNGIIIHTEDGHNWVEQTNPDTEGRTFFDIHFSNNNEGWAVGIQGIIIHTANGGTTWNLEGAELTYESIAGVHFTSPTNGYAVGTRKTLLKYGEVSAIGDEVENVKFEIYPNPAVSVVSLQLPPKAFGVSREPLIVEIYDLNGRKLLEKQIPAGTENIVLNVSGFESGVYFCRIST
jgi:photosystem II stability/assembly factor-like uncharacterized protein